MSKITVYHIAAPTCWWSYGYEPIFNRLKLVYGKQIDVKIAVACVYDDFNAWMSNNDFTNFEEEIEWSKEAQKIMGIPISTNFTRKNYPDSVLPASLATMAAIMQEEKKAERFFRSLLRRFVVEMQDVTKESVLIEAAKEAGLDIEKFKSDYNNTKERTEDLAHQGHGFPHLGFYNIAITDGNGRTIVLDNQFDPKIVEEAIDYLSSKKLKKNKPKDILGYIKEHGLVSTLEISKVFDMKNASKKLSSLHKSKKIEKIKLAKADHWKVV